MKGTKKWHCVRQLIPCIFGARWWSFQIFYTYILLYTLFLRTTPVRLHPGSQESSWLRVWELLVFYLGASGFLLHKSGIIMSQFFWDSLNNSPGHIFYPLKSKAKCPFISERADFSFVDLNNGPCPAVKPEFNNYYYFKLSWYLFQAQNHLSCWSYFSSR